MKLHTLLDLRGAGRAVLRVDQAAPAHQALPGHQRERREDARVVRVATYVLIAIVKKERQLGVSLYRSLPILSVSVFEKPELSCALPAR